MTAAGIPMSAGPRVYLAAALERRGEMRVYARLLERRGVRVVARWLDYDNVDADLDADGRARAAWECFHDLTVADLALVFTPAGGAAVGYQTGGRHVELGIAIGMGKPIVLVGPSENVFHAHGGPWQSPAWAHFHRFETFAECLDAWETLEALAADAAAVVAAGGLRVTFASEVSGPLTARALEVAAAVEARVGCAICGVVFETPGTVCLAHEPPAPDGGVS